MIEPLRVLTTEPLSMASIAMRVPRSQIQTVMGPALIELRAGIANQNIAVTGPWFTHHVRPPGDMFDFEICLPVTAPVAAAGRMRPGSWPAMTVARTVYHGGFEGLGQAWSAFIGQIGAAGHPMADDLWERYLVGPDANADASCWRTELSKPLLGKT